MASNWELDMDARNRLRTDNATMERAMRELALCCRDLIVSTPPDGAGLGEILIGHQFKGILESEGLALVPCAPTRRMRDAWKKGWWCSLYDRYRAMLLAAWETEGL
jgi:hypothetical protein